MTEQHRDAMPVLSGSNYRSFLVDILHIFALCGLAVAQPLFTTVADSPEFLVAHRAGRSEIVAITVLLSIGLPLVIVCAEALLRLISLRAQRFFHVAIVCILLLVVAMQIINHIHIQTTPLAVAVALAVGGGTTALYVWSASIRRTFTILSLGAVFFPISFLFFSPISKIILHGHAEVEGVDASSALTPVVMIVLDEFNPTALLNKNREIDAVRYPNFAELARTATWFPRAISVHPQTQFAVPAILTGRMPDETRSDPSHRSHPQNLFTLLGNTYSVNVEEPLTSLCPISICDHSYSFNYDVFFSDLAVVFLHTIAPKSIGEQLLPRLDMGWQGFASASADKFNLVDEFGRRANNSRLRDFRDFIKNIEPKRKQLSFLHILLPHHPYQFLPDGIVYQGGADVGFGQNDMWRGDPHLINVAYHRYTLQVGLVDTLVGELITHLKEIGIYDSALLIVTGDHGRVFREKTPARALTSSNLDLLHVPLFVKRPHQEEGITDERLVSTIDLVPTVVDQLNIATTWAFDGVSLFAEHRPDDSYVNVTVSGKSFIFDRNEIVRLPQHEHQIRTMGDMTPLADSSILNPFSALVGSDVSDLTIVPGTEEPATLTADIAAFSDIDLQSGYLPSLFKGEIGGFAHRGMVALVLNDKIAAVTPIFLDDVGNHNVLTMIPSKFFVNGYNKFSAYFIQGDVENSTLLPIRTSYETFSLIEEEGNEFLHSSSGRKIPVTRGHLFGYVDSVAIDGQLSVVAGWSADIANLQPTLRVIAFLNGKYVGSVQPTGRREEVAEMFGSPAIRDAGFSITFSKGSSESIKGLRVFGISSNSSGELVIPEGRI